MLRDHCRDLIGGYKVPRTVEFVTDLPLSAAGKVLKRELRGSKSRGDNMQNQLPLTVDGQ